MRKKCNKKLRRPQILCAALLGLLLTGCGAKELEDRCFPMLALVDYDEEKGRVAFSYTFPVPRESEDQDTATGEMDTAFAYGESFREAWKDYESKLNKEADYNHLKVLVLGEAFTQDAVDYEDMLKLLEKEELFPRNAYVCVFRNPDKLLALSDRLSDDAGTYLEDFLENHENSKKRSLVTLGELIDEEENRRRTLYLPYLRVKKKNILWEGYELVDRGVPLKQ